MKSVVDLPNQEIGSPISVDGERGKAAAVLQELERILASRHFKSAGRSRQFLEFVVRQRLAGRVDRLKERTIGTEVFQRSPDYATGDDPVVRVQAGEVRRRLDQYYQESPAESPVSIRLPVGSYSPVFQWASDKTVEVDQAFASTKPEPLSSPTSEVPHPPRTTRRTLQLMTAAACLMVLAFGAGIAFVSVQRMAPKKTLLEQFWNPVFATQQPVLICLAKPVVYRPSSKMYEKFSSTHPGTFQTEVERFNHPLPLDPSEKLTWSDMAVYPEYGVALGDAYAGVSLSGLLGEIRKPSQVRISNYSFEDLRNSPAVVVGAFNNRWTMDLTSKLHFAFVEENGKFTIKEQIPGGRVWRQYATNAAGERTDFAIVGRLLDSSTGQFIVIVAGIDGTGTQAAAEFVSHQEYIEKWLRDAPGDWRKKNAEVVLQTSIIDSTPGPPKVLAAYYW